MGVLGDGDGSGGDDGDGSGGEMEGRACMRGRGKGGVFGVGVCG